MISYLGTIPILLLISVGFIGGVYFSVAQIVRAFAQNQDQFICEHFRSTEWIALLLSTAEKADAAK